MRNTTPILMAQQGILNSGGGGWYTPTIPTVGTLQTATKSSAQLGYMEVSGDYLGITYYGSSQNFDVIDFTTGSGVNMPKATTWYPYALWGADFAPNGDFITFGLNGISVPRVQAFYYNGSVWNLRTSADYNTGKFTGSYGKMNRNNGTFVQSHGSNGRLIPGSYNGTAFTYGTHTLYGSDVEVIAYDRVNDRYLIGSGSSSEAIRVVTTDGSTITLVASAAVPKGPIPTDSGIIEGDTVIFMGYGTGEGSPIYKYTINGSSLDFNYSASWTTAPDLGYALLKVDTNLYLGLSHAGSSRNGVANWFVDTGTSFEVTNEASLGADIDTYNLERYFIGDHPTGGKFLHCAANNVGTLYSYPLT